ncbi:protein kinase [Xenorhabdus bovienii]|uniref:protein kinase domain-containing protein n=1 Tax=Xenorhabdus bovienii TaxID=40576 RepID=UPI00237CD6D3|nr:protein kinase [Xenorhabdus bovienii]MDE1476491.1 protein kinase [Xenorhabdus bovienii]MDE9443626.1 protein kinase [Xenorhabdus bovienii]
MEIHGNYYIKTLSPVGTPGGFGFVEHVILYNSDHNKCGSYAKKTLLLDNFPPEYFEEVKERFKQEVLCQSSCKHKSIVPVYLCNLQAEKPWFIMDLAQNDLASEIQTGKLTLSDKINIIKMVLEGVSFMHKQRDRILHRDIKPQNVLRFSDGTYKISDFGLIKKESLNGTSKALTKIGAFPMGTERYMAPEVLISTDYSVQSDIYSLGKLMEDLSIEDYRIKRLIVKSTKMDKADRYTSVDDILSDLENITGEVRYD